MSFKFNPITGNLDLVGGSSTPGYLPPVDSFANLPPTAPDGTVIAVRDEATVYVYSQDLNAWIPQRGPKDIETTVSNINENAGTTAIAGFVLNNQVTTFESVIELTVTLTDSSIKRCSIHLYATNDGNDWITTYTVVGSLLMNISLNVQTNWFGNPQLYYTSGTEPDFASAVIKFRAKSL